MNIIERTLLGIFNMDGVFSLDGLKRKTGLDVSNEEIQALKEQSKIESIVLKNRTFYWSTECSKKIDDCILKIIHATRSFNVAMALLEFWSVNQFGDKKYTLDVLIHQLIHVQKKCPEYKCHQEKLLQLINDSLEAGHAYFVGKDSILQIAPKGRVSLSKANTSITRNTTPTKNDASNSNPIVSVHRVEKENKAVQNIEQSPEKPQKKPTKGIYA